MSEMEDFDGTLDLSGTDGEVGFAAIPTGKYQGHVHEVEWRRTSNPDGSKALPDATPYLNVQLRVDEEESRDGMQVKNRALFAKLFVPPAEYDAEKAQRMRNSMTNFLISVGYELAAIQKKGFKIDPEALIGRECTIVVKKYMNDFTQDYDNNVQGFKVAGESTVPVGGLV
jgi:hypothetical protein